MPVNEVKASMPTTNSEPPTKGLDNQAQRNLYLAVGDSVTAGYGTTHPRSSFVRHVSDFTRKCGLSERTIVIARSGWTTQEVWKSIRTVNRQVWERTNVLTLMTGGNDLRQLLRGQYLSLSGSSLSPQRVYRRLQMFGMHMDQLRSLIQQQNVPHVVVATVYNPVPNFSLAVHAMEALNGITRAISEHYKFQLVDVHASFLNQEPFFIESYRTGHLEDLSSPIRRPIHPTNAGHQQISSLISGVFAHPLEKVYFGFQKGYQKRK